MNAHDATKILEAAAALAYLTRVEAAKYSRMSPRTIDRWIKEGLPHSGGGPGRKILIRRDHLVDWIERDRDNHHAGEQQ